MYILASDVLPGFEVSKKGWMRFCHKVWKYNAIKFESCLGVFRKFPTIPCECSLVFEYSRKFMRMNGIFLRQLSLISLKPLFTFLATLATEGDISVWGPYLVLPMANDKQFSFFPKQPLFAFLKTAATEGEKIQRLFRTFIECESTVSLKVLSSFRHRRHHEIVR